MQYDSISVRSSRLDGSSIGKRVDRQDELPDTAAGQRYYPSGGACQGGRSTRRDGRVCLFLLAMLPVRWPTEVRSTSGDALVGSSRLHRTGHFKWSVA